MAERQTVTKQDFQVELAKLRDTLDRRDVITRSQIQEALTELAKHKKTIYGNGEPGLDEIARNNRAMIMSNAETLKELKIMVDDFRPVIVFYKVGVWLAGIIGVSVIALIWGVITHTIELVRP